MCLELCCLFLKGTVLDEKFVEVLPWVSISRETVCAEFADTQNRAGVGLEVRTQILSALEEWQELVQRWGAAPAPVAVAQTDRGASSWRGARVGASHPPRASRTWERKDAHGALRMHCKGGIKRASVKSFTG